MPTSEPNSMAQKGPAFGWMKTHLPCAAASKIWRFTVIAYAATQKITAPMIGAQRSAAAGLMRSRTRMARTPTALARKPAMM